MSGGYNPKVANPHMSNNIPQMRSAEFQKPFFFGGAQAPTALGLNSKHYSGSGLGSGYDYLPINRVFHKDGKILNKPQKLPFLK
jgi:hypothetical protein